MFSWGSIMKIAAIELHVPVKPGKLSDGAAIIQALRADPAARRRAAMNAIAAASAAGAQVIVCPGWTFVGRAPTAKALAKAAPGATIVFEMLDESGGTGRNRRGKSLDATNRKAQTLGAYATLHAFDGKKVRDLPPQVFATGAEVEESAERFSQALAERAVGDAVVLCCGEVNVVRRYKEGAGVGHRWDGAAEAAGAREARVRGKLILNPAHTPSGGYVRAKRRAGPWRALISAANTLARGGLTEGAHGVRGGEDCEPVGVLTLFEDDPSRVVVYEV
jgi:hypothetical protein